MVTFLGRKKKQRVCFFSTSTTWERVNVDPFNCNISPFIFTRLTRVFSPFFNAEIAWKWAPKQTVDGSQKEIHGNRITPSGI